MTAPSAIEVATPTPYEIVFRRIYRVERSLVFDAWTQVEHVRQWWDPRGLVLAACEIDLRIGGRFRFVHQSFDGTGHAFEGTYLEIERPQRLVFETRQPSAVGTLLFEPIGADDTVLLMSIRCASEQARDALLQVGFVQGTTRTLQNLEDHIRDRGAVGQDAAASPGADVDEAGGPDVAP